MSTDTTVVNAFRGAIAGAGLTAPERIVADGALHRFPTNGKRDDLAGWYVLHLDGVPAGSFGCWRKGLTQDWRANVGRQLTEREQAELERRAAEARRQREQAERERHAAAARQAAQEWESAAPANPSHPYLVLKGIKPHGLRVDASGRLLVPLFDATGEWISMQRIDENGQKRFLAGGKVAGGYWLIGEPRAVLVICEGFATGASIHEATGHPVAVAFNASNLATVARVMREQNPNTILFIAADDDAATEGNPGLTKAREAAAAVAGRLVAPDFGPERPAGATDFNDLMRLRGPEAVRAGFTATATTVAATETAGAPSILMGPDRATLRPDLFERPPEPPAMVIEGFEPRDAGVIPGAGGTGKTTIELWLAIHRILGAPVFGCDIVQPGPVLYVSAEDSRERIEYRVWRICDALNMNEARRRSVLAGLYIEDLSSTRWRLVEADERGNLSATALCDRLTDLYANRGLSAAVLDPLVYFGPGERYVNDGEAEVMLAARTMSRRLSCAVRFPHHTGKGQAREGTSDQYAGRGGSAGADNARFVHVLMTHTPGTIITEPAGLRGEDIAAGNILRLHVAKLTDARRPSEPFWLRREGWRLDWIPPQAEDPAVREAAALRELCMMIRAEASRGVRHTERSLTDAFRPGEHIRTRYDLKTLRHIAEQRGHIVRRPLPKEERQGSRNYFFEVASTP
jgi:phage/plasmid primase-like uncharacterized protein